MGCDKYNCPNINIYGQCMVSACNYHENNLIIKFPQTIGDITFYTPEELISWVTKEQIKNRRLIQVITEEI